jgi:hypothetical protein
MMPTARRRVSEGGTYVNLVARGQYGDVSGDPHMRELDGAEADKLTLFLYEELNAFRRAAACPLVWRLRTAGSDRPGRHGDRLPCPPKEP